MLNDFYSKLNQVLQADLGVKPDDILKCTPNTGEFLRWSDKPNKTNLYLLIQSWDFNKNTYYKAYYGDWREGGEPKVFKSYSETESLSKAFKNKEAAADKDAKNAKEIRQKIEYSESFNKHNTNWLKAAPGNHFYLDQKQINPFKSKVLGDTLYVPTYDESLNIHGFQIIYKNQLGETLKIFPKALSPKGNFLHLKDFLEASTVYLVEGFATGASLQMCINEPVIVGFSTGNLPSAAMTIRKINPRAKIMIAVDHDFIDEKTNKRAGHDAAMKTQKALGGTNCEIVTPIKEGDDWNDLFLREGKEAVRKQVTTTKTEMAIKKLPIDFLGHEKDTDTLHFFTYAGYKRISLKSNQINTSGLLTLYPNLDYWIDAFPNNNKVNCDRAQEHIIKKQYEFGKYHERRIRGNGVFLDQDAVVIHNGDKTTGKPKNSNYFYLPDNEPGVYKIGDAKKHNLPDLKRLYSLAHTHNPNENFFISGFVVQSMIFPIFSWVYNLFIFGKSKAGKSWHLGILEKLIPNLFKGQNSSPASIFRDIKSDQTVVIMDEFEPAFQYRQEVIDGARTCNRRSDQPNYTRTKQDGSVLKLYTNATFLFAAVQLGEMNEADRGRIVTIELKDNSSQNPADFVEMQELAEKLTKNTENNFAAVVERIPVLLESFNLYLTKLKEQRLDSRDCETLANALACNYILLHDTVDEKIINKECSEIKNLKLSYIENNKEKEDADALRDLMAMVVLESQKMSLQGVLWALKKGLNNTGNDKTLDYYDLLTSYGLKFNRDNCHLFISNRNQNRNLKLGGKYPNLASVLSANSDLVVKRNHTTRLIRGDSIKGSTISLKSMFEDDGTLD